MIDALHFEASLQIVPAIRFVGINDRAEFDTGFNPSLCRAFRSEHGGNRAAIALPNDDNGFALAALVFGKATVNRDVP
jgi:hypothetical protein